VKQLVNKGGFAVVNVGDDGHVSDFALLHYCSAAPEKNETGAACACCMNEKMRNVPQKKQKDKGIGGEAVFLWQDRTEF
jgi:hypothetical protein